MSALSAASLSASFPSSSLSSSLPTSGLPPIDPSREPEAVRNGGTAAKKAYQEGLAFEDILVNQLAQQMTATVPGLDGSSSSDDGLGGSTGDSTGNTSGGMGSSSAIGAYASMLPQALSSSVMSGGGTGIAMQIARSIDPALGVPKQ